jgi:hypothetical protein
MVRFSFLKTVRREKTMVAAGLAIAIVTVAALAGFSGSAGASSGEAQLHFLFPEYSAKTGPLMRTMVKADNPTLRFAIAPIPTNDGKPQQTVSVTDSLGISSKAAHKAEAWKFVTFMYQLADATAKINKF